jgi:hypothetical protein
MVRSSSLLLRYCSARGASLLERVSGPSPPTGIDYRHSADSMLSAELMQNGFVT